MPIDSHGNLMKALAALYAYDTGVEPKVRAGDTTAGLTLRWTAFAKVK